MEGVGLADEGKRVADVLPVLLFEPGIRPEFVRARREVEGVALDSKCGGGDGSLARVMLKAQTVDDTCTMTEGEIYLLFSDYLSFKGGGKRRRFSWLEDHRQSERW